MCRASLPDPIEVLAGVDVFENARIAGLDEFRTTALQQDPATAHVPRDVTERVEVPRIEQDDPQWEPAPVK